MNVADYIPIAKRLKSKYIIISVILLFFLIVIIINVFSYINILSKSSENSEVKKSRATSVLTANVALLLILIFFVGYYGYKYFIPSPLANGKYPAFDIQNMKFPNPPKKGPYTGCADAESMSILEKLKKTPISNNIDLRPNKCSSKGCNQYKEDPANPKTKCDKKSSGYNYTGVIRSLP
jgi:hypothetical protein